MKPGFERVAKVGEIPEGQGRSYMVNGRLIAVFNAGGSYRAMSDTCPHMGASLAAGYVEGDAVCCPWHAWRFCVHDGRWLDAPNSPVRTETFEVQVVDGDIWVLVPDPAAG